MNMQDLTKKIIGKNVYIYGAGDDGIRLFHLISHGRDYELKGYIDRNAELHGTTQFGLPIFPPEKARHLAHNDLIVIASQLYCREIERNLRRMGVSEELFVIWRTGSASLDDGRYHAYLNHNKEIWGQAESAGNKQNKVLVSYSFNPLLDLVVRSYVSNILAKRYDAEIWGLKWYFSRSGYQNDTYWSIYHSFGVCGLIEESLTEGQRETVERAMAEHLKKCRNRHDYRRIEVFGIDFGKEIMGDFARQYYPIIDVSDAFFVKHLKSMFSRIVFWHSYFNEHSDIKAIVFQDAIFREGIVRKLAVLKGIPCYAAPYTAPYRIGLQRKYSFQYYKMFFLSLSEEEQKLGLEIGKKHLESRLSGSDYEISGFESAFYKHSSQRVLEQSDRIKVMIFHHYFEEDGFPYGETLFDDQWDWLCTLGEWSKNTDYDWYLKLHVVAGDICRSVIKRFSQLYPHIKIVDKDVSPQQLKAEGLDFALTIYGSIGHEYPALGIQVINAGINPHIAFDFTWTPKSIEEYHDWILNLESLKKSVDLEEMYIFYCIHYHWFEQSGKSVVEKIYGDGKKADWIWYHFDEAMDRYLDSFTPEKHTYLLKFFSDLLEKEDNRLEESFVGTEEYTQMKESL